MHNFISGIMAQNIALKVHLDQLQKKEFAMHPTSHLELHENKAYEHIWGFKSILIGGMSLAIFS